MSKRLDLKNKRFDYLKVIEYSGIKYNHSEWKCLCNCGKIITTLGVSLINGNTTSCGCKRKKDKLVNSFKRLYKKYKRDANNRGFTFNLTQKEFKVLTSSNCYYCGTEPINFVKSAKGQDITKHYKYNGVDRKNSNLGYTKKNCVSCCANCNYAKRNLSFKDFLAHITKIYNHSIKGLK